MIFFDSSLLEGSAIKCQRDFEILLVSVLIFGRRTEYVTMGKWISQNKKHIFVRLKINLRKLLRRAACVLSIRQTVFLAVAKLQ